MARERERGDDEEADVVVIIFEQVRRSLKSTVMVYNTTFSLYTPLSLSYRRSASSIHPPQLSEPVENSSSVAKIAARQSAQSSDGIWEGRRTVQGRSKSKSTLREQLVDDVPICPQSAPGRVQEQERVHTPNGTPVSLRAYFLSRLTQLEPDWIDILASDLVGLLRPAHRADHLVQSTTVLERCGRSKEELSDPLRESRRHGRTGEPGGEVGAPPCSHTLPQDETDVGVVDRAS